MSNPKTALVCGAGGFILIDNHTRVDSKRECPDDFKCYGGYGEKPG